MRDTPLTKEINMSTIPQPELLYAVMAWVSTLALLFVIGGAIYMVRRQLKKYRKTKASLASVFVWIAASFVFASVLMSTAAGAVVAAFAGDVLGLGYIKPITLAFDVFIIGAVFMVSAGIVAVLSREPKAKSNRKDEHGEARPDDQHRGIDVFSSTGS